MTLHESVVLIAYRPTWVTSRWESLFKNFKSVLGGVTPDADPFSNADATMYGEMYGAIMPNAYQIVGGSTNPFTVAQRALVRAANPNIAMIGYVFEGNIAPYAVTATDSGVMDGTGLAAGAHSFALSSAPAGTWLGNSTRFVGVIEAGTNNEESFIGSRATGSATITVATRDLRGSGNTTHAAAAPVLFFRQPATAYMYGDEAETTVAATGVSATATRLLKVWRADVRRYVETIFHGLRIIDEANDAHDTWDYVLFDTTSWDTLISVTTTDPYNSARHTAGVESGTSIYFDGFSGADWTREQRAALAQGRAYARRKGSQVGLGANCLGDGNVALGYRNAGYTSDGTKLAGFEALQYADVCDVVMLEQWGHGQKDKLMGQVASPNPSDGNFISTIQVKRHLNTLFALDRKRKSAVVQTTLWPDHTGTTGLTGSTVSSSSDGLTLTLVTGTIALDGSSGANRLRPQPTDTLLGGLQVYVSNGIGALDSARIAAATPTTATVASPVTGSLANKNVSCTTVNGSTTVTFAANAIVVGDIAKTIIGTGIPTGTFITARPTTTTATISAAATSSATNTMAVGSAIFFGMTQDHSKRWHAYLYGLFLIANNGRHAYQYRDDNVTLPDSFNPGKASNIHDGVVGLPEWRANRQVQRATNYYHQVLGTCILASGNTTVQVPSNSVTAANIGATIYGGTDSTHGFTRNTTTILSITDPTHIVVSAAPNVSGSVTAAIVPLYNHGAGQTWWEKIDRGFAVPIDYYAHADDAELASFPGVFVRRFVNGVILVNTTAAAAASCYVLPAGTYYQLGDVSQADDATTVSNGVTAISVPARTGLLLRTVA